MSESAAPPRTTIIVTQRERFGMTAESLENLYENTDEPFELIYVDAGSPRGTKACLERASAERGFRLIRREAYLTPNQARNLGLAEARTEFVVFVDNDTLFTRGWLSALIDCADETGAWIVAPLTCHALPAHATIHHAGGDFTEAEDPRAFFEADPAKGRPFVETMHGHNVKVADYAPKLRRERTGYCEFHVAFARRDAFERIGPLDENLMSTKEHIDFSMMVWKAGGEVWFEPTSVVTYVMPNRHRPLTVADWPFFALRWSDAYGARSLEHFVAKWGLATPPGYVAEKRGIYAYRRYQAILVPIVRSLPLVSRSRQLTQFGARLLGPFEKVFNRALVSWHGAKAR